MVCDFWSIWDAFWGAFGGLWGFIFGGFRSRIALRCPSTSKTVICTKPYENQYKINKNAPGDPPKRPQIDPSGFQDATFLLLNFDPVFGSIWSQFWLPKCLAFGTLLVTKIDPKIDRKLGSSQYHTKISPRPPRNGSWAVLGPS